MFTALVSATPRAMLVTTMFRITMLEEPVRKSNFSTPPLNTVPPAARFVLPAIRIGSAGVPE